MKIRIAYDLDNTLVNLTEVLENYVRSVLDFELNLLNPAGYTLHERYKIKNRKSLVESFVKDGGLFDVELYDGVTETLDFVRRQGIDQYVITARAKDHEVPTRKWFAQSGLGLPLENLIFSDQKGKLAKDLGIKVFVEDKVENIKDISRYAIVLAYEQDWNQDLIPKKNIVKVKDWSEIRSFFETYLKKI